MPIAGIPYYGMSNSAHKALLEASRAFAKAAAGRLEEKTVDGNDQAIKLLEAAIKAFIACRYSCDADARLSRRRKSLDLSTDEGWDRAAASFG